MNIKNNQLTGYILAGGKSSRMGVDKGLLQFKGKAIIEHVIEQIQTVVQKVVIVSNNPEYEKFGLEVIPDLVKNIGPAGGIYTALKHSGTNLNFVVSCDMPFINRKAIEFLLQSTDSYQIVLPEFRGKLEPMFGVYSRECLPLWKGLIEKGVIKLQSLVSHFNLRKINVDDNSFFTELTFMNINTKTDFENARKLSTG